MYDYFIVESKYNTAQIKMGSPRQMSDPWINLGNRLINAVISQSIVNDITLNGYTRLVARIQPDGSVKYKILNSERYDIGEWKP